MTPDELRDRLSKVPDGYTTAYITFLLDSVTALLQENQDQAELLAEANQQIANLRGGLQQSYVKRTKTIKQIYELRRQKAGDTKRLETEVEKQKTIALAWKRRYKKAIDDLSSRQEQIEIIHLKEEIGMLKAQKHLLEFALTAIHYKAIQTLNDVGYFSPQG